VPPLLAMPCCGALVHLDCLRQCVQLRAVRKNCCACQQKFSAATQAAFDDACGTAARCERTRKRHVLRALDAGLSAGGRATNAAPASVPRWGGAGEDDAGAPQ
jgi:hypothetical protein